MSEQMLALRRIISFCCLTVLFLAAHVLNAQTNFQATIHDGEWEAHNSGTKAVTAFAFREAAGPAVLMEHIFNPIQPGESVPIHAPKTVAVDIPLVIYEDGTVSGAATGIDGSDLGQFVFVLRRAEASELRKWLRISLSEAERRSSTAANPHDLESTAEFSIRDQVRDVLAQNAQSPSSIRLEKLRSVLAQRLTAVENGSIARVK